MIDRFFFTKTIGNSIMSRFRIIPVIDILNGIAVHANKGLRNTYQPIHTKFSNSSHPIDLLKSYYENYRFEEVYIADLDSIIRESPNTDLLLSLAKDSPLKIMLDAGIRNMYDILHINALGLNKIILATETIDSFDVIDDAINELGGDKIIVSIDMKNQKIISDCEDISQMDVYTVIDKLKKRNIREIILLDLAKIGSLRGDSGSDYQEIREKYPEIKFIVGGGIKDIKDIVSLEQSGFNGGLIATALHTGKITPTKIHSFYHQ